MLSKGKTVEPEEQGVAQLEELLPKLNKAKRAFIKGAAKALLYAQEKKGKGKRDKRQELREKRG